MNTDLDGLLDFMIIPTLVLTFLALVVLVGFPVWGVVDAVRKPRAAWESVGKSRGVWVLVQVCFGVVGAIVYLAWVRPKLVDAVGARTGIRSPMDQSGPTSG